MSRLNEFGHVSRRGHGHSHAARCFGFSPHRAVRTSQRCALSGRPYHVPGPWQSTQRSLTIPRSISTCSTPNPPPLRLLDI